MRNGYLIVFVTFLFLSSCGCQSTIDASSSLSEPKIVRLTAYDGTLCAIKDDGSLTVWGGNVFGGIGNGKIDSAKEGCTPVPPYTHTFDDKIIDAGSMVSSYALTENGSLYVWGLNSNGECGMDPAPILFPQKVDDIADIKQFSMSTAFSLALDNRGSVYHAGVKIEQFYDSNDYEWNYFEDADRDMRFTELPLEFTSVKIDSSVCSYVFLTDTSEVYMQGILLGDALRQSADICYPEPVKIEFPEKIVDIAALTTNIVAVSESGKIYVFGWPESGLSDDETDIKISELIYQKRLEDVVAVDGTDYCVMAVTANGDGYAWGLDIYGQILKSNEGKPREQYKKISEPTKLNYSKIKQFTMGVSNGTIIDQSGNIFIWGDKSTGQMITLE